MIYTDGKFHADVKLPVDGFNWVKDTFHHKRDFRENCNENKDEAMFLKLMLIIWNLHNLHNDLPFHLKKWEYWKTWKACSKIAWEKRYFVHIRSLKEAINHRYKKCIESLYSAKNHKENIEISNL